MRKKLVRTSKFLSLVLRHKPDQIGIKLDHQGWVSIAELLDAAEKADTHLSRDLLHEVVSSNEKQRFAISDDGLRIRANQGHSIGVDLELEPVVPPERLYHGTAKRFLASILAEGLRRRGRQYVHLSSTTETATEVGKRHGKPVVLQVRAKAMHAEGYALYLSKNGVWLTDHVPATFIINPRLG